MTDDKPTALVIDCTSEQLARWSTAAAFEAPRLTVELWVLAQIEARSRSIEARLGLGDQDEQEGRR